MTKRNPRWEKKSKFNYILFLRIIDNNIEVNKCDILNSQRDK